MGQNTGNSFGSAGLGKNLQASGDTSATEFATWTVFTQSMQGMWMRKYVYNTSPTYSAGVASGAPTMAYSYLDTNCTVTTRREFVDAAYASGYAQNLGIAYISDSTVGGFGGSGIFYSSSIGITRKEKVATDVESYCTTTFDTDAGEYPGQYLPNQSLDTSATFPGTFFSDVIMPAARHCPELRVSLINV